MVKLRNLNPRLATKIKIVFIIMITCFLFFESLPSVYSSTRNGITESTSDFGVLQALNEVLTDKESKLNSPEIENETKKRLDDMKLVEIENKSGEFNYQIKSAPKINPKNYEPIIFEELKKNTNIVNNTSILEFLINQPLNYAIFTKSNNTITWTDALLRRSLVFPKFNPWRWEDIDVDNNVSNGNEIRVRFDIVIDTDNWDFQRPRLTPLPPSPGGIKMKGGFGLTIERTTSRDFPLELYIAKSISYEGQNYIWTTGALFDSTPTEYSSELLAETIELDGLSQTLINSLIGGGLGNLVNTTLAEINGPYSLRYESKSDLKKFNLIVGMIKYENLTLTNKNWLVFYTTPAEGYEFVTRSGEVFVDSSNVQAPIDQLKWTSGYYDQSGINKIPINLRIRYGEDQDDYVYANVELVNLPKWYTIKIDYTKVANNRNVTVLEYSASDTLRTLNYNSYFYPQYTEPLTESKFNCTHVLLEDVPTHFRIEMTSDIGRDINTTPSNNPQSGIVANILNSLILRVANRFYRIGKYLKLAAEGILELPSNEGWALIDMDVNQLSKLEFYQTSGEYIDRPGNYFAFYNISASENQELNSTGKDTAEFALSARLTGLKWANLSFSTPLEFELRAFNGEPFVGLLVDGQNLISAYISNIPEYIKVKNLETNSFYSTVDPEVDYTGAEGTIINQFKFTSQFDNQLIQLNINKIPNGLEFNRQDEVINFAAIGDGFIDELNYLVTSDLSLPIHQLDSGDFIYIYQDEDFITSSGRLTGLKKLTYDSSENGFFELGRNKETPFKVMLIDNKTQRTKAKLILDPLPSNFKIDLPGIVRKSNIDFPEITNITGEEDYSNIIFTLGSLGAQVVTLLGNLSEYLIESIGSIGINFSISYELETLDKTLDMIAEIERGGIQLSSSPENPYSTSTDEILGYKLGWTHGIYMKQDFYEGEEILRGHLYLQGMPRAATLSTTFEFNTTNVQMDFKDYYPRYNWLLLDLQGIQNRDVNVFFQHIPEGVDLTASVDLTANLEIGGELVGDIDISFCDAGSNICTRPLGALYVNMHTYFPIQSIREVFISELPSELHINFTMQKEVKVLYEASKEIDFIFSKLSKILTDSWHHMNIILHDIPKWFKFDLYTNTDFDMDDPLPLQGMPDIEIDTKKTNTLDLIVSLDGAAVGQRGNIDLFLQNAQDMSAQLNDDEYLIESEGLDYLRLKITNLPLLDNYKLNALIIESEDLTSLEFKVNLLFDVFPYFDLGSNSEGKIEVRMDHTITLFGREMRAHIALIDIVYENAGGGRIPMGTPIFVNTINSDLTKTRDHLIIPAPIISFFSTWTNNI